jgi:hypothetical protein
MKWLSRPVQHISKADDPYSTKCGIKYPTMRDCPKRPYCRRCMDEYLDGQEAHIDSLWERLQAVAWAGNPKVKVSVVAHEDGGGMFVDATQRNPMRTKLIRDKPQETDE